MRKWQITASAFVGIASWGLVTTAVADDLFPPSWRGTNGSTFQEWTFSNPNNPTGPNAVNNPYGSPSALINFNPPFGTGWYDTVTNVYGNKQGFWDIANGSIALTLPNLPNNNVAYETIQIQITYWRDLSQAPGYGYSSSPFATQTGSTTTTLVLDPPGPGAWYSDLSLWHVTPNPNMDTITILGDLNFGSVIDQIVIDTLAVPEPSTTSLMALALGGAILWSLRRRKN